MLPKFWLRMAQTWMLWMFLEEHHFVLLNTMVITIINITLDDIDEKYFHLPIGSKKVLELLIKHGAKEIGETKSKYFD